MSPLHAALVECHDGEKSKSPEPHVQIKSNLSVAVQGVLPIMSLSEAVFDTLKAAKEDKPISSTLSEVFVEFLEDLLSDIYLFSETPDIMTVILDTLNYESDYLTTR